MARRRRSSRIAVRRAVLAIGLIGLLAGLTLTIVAGSPARLAAGTTIAGAHVGGLELGEATRTARAALGCAPARAGRVRRRRAHLPADGVAAGRPPRLGGRSPHRGRGERRLRAGSGHPAHPDEALRRRRRADGSTSIRRSLRYSVARIAAAVDRPAVDAAVRRRGLRIDIAPARTGIRLDRRPHRRRSSWRARRARASWHGAAAVARDAPSRDAGPARRRVDRRPRGPLRPGDAHRRPDPVPARPLEDRRAAPAAERR